MSMIRADARSTARRGGPSCSTAARTSTSSATATSSRAGSATATYPLHLHPDDLAARTIRATPAGPGRTGRAEAVVARRLQRPRPAARSDGRLHLRQPGHDPQRRGRCSCGAASPSSTSRRSSTGRRARTRHFSAAEPAGAAAPDPGLRGRAGIVQVPGWRDLRHRSFMRIGEYVPARPAATIVAVTRTKSVHAPVVANEPAVARTSPGSSSRRPDRARSGSPASSSSSGSGRAPSGSRSRSPTRIPRRARSRLDHPGHRQEHRRTSSSCASATRSPTSPGRSGGPTDLLEPATPCASAAASGPRSSCRSPRSSTRRGVAVTSIIGGRSREWVILEDELRAGRRGHHLHRRRQLRPAGLRHPGARRRARGGRRRRGLRGRPGADDAGRRRADPAPRGPDHRLAQRDHGRRHRDVRRLPGHGRRRDAATPASTGPSSTATGRLRGAGRPARPPTARSSRRRSSTRRLPGPDGWPPGPRRLRRAARR